jgi:predicted lipoprotein with Yx(FWY)xxD motif
VSGTSRVISATAAAAVLLVLAACGPVTTAGEATFDVAPVARQETAPLTAPVTAAGESSGAGPVSVNAAEVDGVGRVLTDQAGMTLYRYDRDAADPPASECDGICVRAWPPVVVEDLSEVVVSGMARNLLGTLTRPDDTRQLTVGGWPVYRFARDSAPGEAGGQGAGGVWFAIGPDGGKVGAPAATAPPPAGGTGPALTARVLPGFGPALTDAKGFTLYLFTRDDTAPAKSACLADCTRRWPPVPAGNGKPTLSGVDPAIVGAVQRPDGTRQATVGGWPVYRFADDAEPGQTGGHGVEGTWFVIEPAGHQSRAPVQEQAPEAPAEPEPGDGY